MIGSKTSVGKTELYLSLNGFSFPFVKYFNIALFLKTKFFLIVPNLPRGIYKLKVCFMLGKVSKNILIELIYHDARLILS